MDEQGAPGQTEICKDTEWKKGRVAWKEYREIEQQMFRLGKLQP